MQRGRSRGGAAARSGRIASVYRRAAKRFSDDGLVRGAAHILRKYLRRVVRYDCVYWYSRPQNERLSAQAVSSLQPLSIHQASRKEVVRLEHDSATDCDQYARRATEGLARARSGQKCFIATHDGQIVGKAWVVEEGTWFVSEVQADERIGTDAILIFDCATIPEYRGRRVYQAILRHINDVYLDRRKLIYCEEENLASRRGIGRDFRLEKRLYLFRICGINFRWSRSEPVFAASGLSPDAAGDQPPDL